MHYQDRIFTIFTILALSVSVQVQAAESITRSAEPLASSINVAHNLALCSMKLPPADAKLIEAHGLNLYAHPKDLSANFSGCRYMWLEDGTMLYRMYYQRGEIVGIRGNDPGEAESICYYVKGKLDRKASINPDGCRAL